MSAVRTPGVNNKHAKRQGAKAVKKLERIHSSGDLTPVEATGFRALSARANYLAQDRPDLAFSTKELCREFAVPNAASFFQLKRVITYLVGLPRLVCTLGKTVSHIWTSSPILILLDVRPRAGQRLGK